MMPDGRKVLLCVALVVLVWVVPWVWFEQCGLECWSGYSSLYTLWIAQRTPVYQFQQGHPSALYEVLILIGLSLLVAYPVSCVLVWAYGKYASRLLPGRVE